MRAVPIRAATDPRVTPYSINDIDTERLPRRGAILSARHV